MIKNPSETVTLDPGTSEKYKACLIHLDNFKSQATAKALEQSYIDRWIILRQRVP